MERPLHLRSRRRLELAAVLATAFAFAWPMQGGGSLQNAHYVLVKAFASGTARIDDTVGDVATGTNDVTSFEGHLYSNKAPGLAAFVLPVYVVLREVGVETVGDPVRMQWALGLFSGVLPAVVLLLLVRRVVERVEPGFGTAAAVVLGAATLVLPFATLLLSHVLSTALVFAAFALLFEERRGPPRLALCAAAGLLVGLAVTVEYPNALAVAILGLYLLARSPRRARALAYAGAALAGAAPVALYNVWAFGSLAHSTYDIDAANDAASLFGMPSLAVVLDLFVSQQGLFVISPVLACCLVGIWLLARSVWRAEALVIVGLALAYTLLSAAWWSPFGGFSPGPRFLITALPFLVVALAPVFRVAPVTTGALALVSAGEMVLLTATHPLAGYDGRWVERLGEGDVPLTAASLVGITGWYAILPALAAVALAGWFALRSSPPVPLRPLDTALAGATVLLWALLAATADDGGQGGAGVWSYLAAALLVCAIAFAASVVAPGRGLGARLSRRPALR